jgi:hypothetical protein
MGRTGAFGMNMIGRIVAVTALGLVVTPVLAQEESTNQVAAMTDWSVFTEDNPQECWGVSAPRESTAARDGQPVQARRGDILLFVTFRPGAGAAGEVSFTSGYPFAEGSTVSVNIGGTAYTLFADGEWAWPASPEEDARLLAAMKAGSDATIVGRSGRGTETTDTFSLRGFTAAMTEAESRCAS